MMKKLFLTTLLLSNLVYADNMTATPFSSVQRQCSNHNPHACQELANRYRTGKRGAKRNGYNAMVHAYWACQFADNLRDADRYCATGLPAIAKFTHGACAYNETYHRLCQMGSKTACLHAAQMNRTGWHGEKEPCTNPEIYGDGKPSPQRAAQYTRQAAQAQGDTPNIPAPLATFH